MDIDIDMDIDIQLDGDDFMDADETLQAVPEVATTSQVLNIPPDPVATELIGALPILDKVHIRGVDHLSSADLKRYAGEHYSLDQFERIEWIDDSSANFIYSTAAAAGEALEALLSSDASGGDWQAQPLALRPAKPFSQNAEAALYVRQATDIDVKKKGAHETSRYYLLNPDQDPRERRNRQDPRRPRGNRRADGNGEYTRLTFDDNEHKKRRRHEATNGFGADMYDDDAGDESTGRPSTFERRKRIRTRRSKEELFPSNANANERNRLRDRSASPTREGDGRLGFSDELTSSRARVSRQRSRSPRRDTLAKELFPLKAAVVTTAAPKELFPSLTSPTAGMRSVELTPPSTTDARLNRNSLELFPNKRGSFSHHRRTAAFDSTPGRERSLAERITARPATAPHDEIRVRGAADTGMSIRGMAVQQQPPPPSVRELFPLKAGGNAGKELFGEKIKGRGGPRRKAEDMFS